MPTNTWNVINPSDPIVITSAPGPQEHASVALATLLLGEGKYSSRELEGVREVPMFPITGHDEWLLETFGKDIDGLLQDVELKLLAADVLASAKCVGERSSLNDIAGRARELAAVLRENAQNVS